MQHDTTTAQQQQNIESLPLNPNGLTIKQIERTVRNETKIERIEEDISDIKTLINESTKNLTDQIQNLVSEVKSIKDNQITLQDFLDSKFGKIVVGVIFIILSGGGVPGIMKLFGL